MDTERGVIVGVTVVVLVVSLLSGPLVAGVDLSPSSSDDGPVPGTGNATVEVISVPETARLDEGSFGRNAPYALVVSDATVRVSNVTGGPMLVYKLRIPELGYTRGTTHFLDESSSGRLALELTRTTLEGNFSHDQYRGELLVVLRGDGPDRTLYRGNVTVEVVR